MKNQRDQNNEWSSVNNNVSELAHGVCVCVLTHFTCVRLFMTPWTAVLQAPLSTGFSREEYWSGMPCPPPGDLLDPGIEPASFMSPALAGGFFTTGATEEAPLAH